MNTIVKPSELERLTLSDCELKFASGDDGQAGEIVAYASIFGELDQGGDVVAKGAFAKSLRERKREDRWDIPMFFGHAHASVPIGVWNDFREDKKGLLAKGKLLLANSENARQVRDVILAGGGMGVSIGYRTRKSVWVSPTGERSDEWRPGWPRHLEEVDLHECSLTAMPMCRGAQVTAAKSLSDGEAEDEASALIRHVRASAEALHLKVAIDDATQRLRALGDFNG